MADKYAVEVRVTGKDFTTELLRPSEVADLLRCIEDLFRSIVARDNPALGLAEDDLVVGLASITQGSLINTFVTPYEAEVNRALELTAEAISSGNFASLPFSSIEALQQVRKFNRRHSTDTEFGRRNGGYIPLATITPKTKIQVHTFVVKGTNTFYGQLLRIGGVRPPRAWIRFINGKTFSCRVKNTTLAREMAQHLYQRIGVRGVAHWDIRDMSLHDFRVEQLLSYQQVELTDAFSNLREVAGKHFEGIDDVEAQIADIRGNDEND